MPRGIANSTNLGCAYRFNRAIVRCPSQSIVHGLRDGVGESPDYDCVVAEHQAYVAALQNAGVVVTVLPPLEAFPDSVFVEDPALVFGNTAVTLRPGADSRRGEAAAIEPDLKQHFSQVLSLGSGGFADGGDILWTGREVMIGLSSRTDTSGASALSALLATLGLSTKTVRTPPGVLHFKSDCSLVDDRRILATRRLAVSGVFDSYDVILVPDGEEGAANALRVNDQVLLSKGYPETQQMLSALGYAVVTLETRDIQKVDAGLSCMSLRFMQNPTEAAAT